MNAVICTDGTSVDDLKSLANVPDMKGLELASKFLLKNHIFGDETLLIESALDLGIKTIFFAILLKIAIKVFLLINLHDDLASFCGWFFLVLSQVIQNRFQELFRWQRNH
jgi:hypothetical protein